MRRPGRIRSGEAIPRFQTGAGRSAGLGGFASALVPDGPATKGRNPALGSRTNRAGPGPPGSISGKENDRVRPQRRPRDVQRARPRAPSLPICDVPRCRATRAARGRRPGRLSLWPVPPSQASVTWGADFAPDPHSRSASFKLAPGEGTGTAAGGDRTRLHQSTETRRSLIMRRMGPGSTASATADGHKAGRGEVTPRKAFPPLRLRLPAARRDCSGYRPVLRPGATPPSW